MNFLYNLIINLIDIYIFFSSKINDKNKKILEGRKKTFSYIEENNLFEKKPVWIHVSSVGEFEQAKPIIKSIKLNYRLKLLITYYSSSVETQISEHKQIDFHFYLPSDTSKNMRKIFELIRPKVLIIVKYEFWKNFISTANEKSIPIVSVSSIFRRNQIYFFPLRFFKNILNKISLFLVQNSNSLTLLKGININNIKVVGDTRYDRVLEILENFKEINKIKEFINGKNTIVIGSSWKSDIEKIKNEIIRDLTDTKYIIVPHNINNKELEYLENIFINDTIRYSDLPQKNIKKRILIINNMGMLSSIYKYGKIAFIGGGFRGALHNTLEAAVWNIPIIYGDHTKNKKFIEVESLEKKKIGFPIKNGNEFKLIKNRIFKNRDVGKGGYEFIKSKAGATNKIIGYLNNYLK